MKIDDDWPDKVYVEKSQLDRIHELTSKAEAGKQVPFGSLKEVLMASAVLGYNIGQKDKIDERKEIIFTRYLDSQFDLPLVVCLAIADQQNVDVVNDKKEVINIFQSYIKGGFDTLYEAITDGSDQIVSYAEYLLKDYIKE